MSFCVGGDRFMMLVYPGIGLGCIERMNYIYIALDQQSTPVMTAGQKH